MRVMPVLTGARSDPDGERGAVAVIFAISLIAIMAIAMLTIDAGNLFFKRRAMVNGADAAALAAAQACARVSDTAVPETVADTNATMNVSGLTAANGGITSMVGCDVAGTGMVTVKYTKAEQNFFAQVLGFGNTTNVSATATAVWGSAVGANAPLPIVLNLGTLQGPCPIPAVAIGTTCYLWYDNDRFTPSNFGFMSLSQFDVDPAYSCDHAGGANDIQSWIDGSWTGPPLNLNYPDPTYVCSLTGGTSAAWAQALDAIATDTDPDHHIKYFPINDDAGQIMNGPQLDKFDIVGYAALSVDGIWKGNQAPAECYAVPNPPTNSSAYCLKISWQGYQFGDGTCCGGLDLGLREVQLCDPVLGTCTP
jgi:Flp pilus assembly protein TadG